MTKHWNRIACICILMFVSGSYSLDVKVLSAKNDPDIQVGYQMVAPALGVKPYTICSSNNSYWVVSKKSFSACEDALRLFPVVLGSPTKANLKKNHSACLGVSDLPGPIKSERGSALVIKEQVMPCSKGDSMKLATHFSPRYIKRDVDENIEYCSVVDSVIMVDSATQESRTRIRHFQEVVGRTIPSAKEAKPFLSAEGAVFVLGGCLTEKELTKVKTMIGDGFVVYQIRDHR